MTQEREQVKRPQPRDSKGRYTKETEHAEVPQERDPAAQELVDLSDELLDEIDTILEEQQVLTNYRQRGGE